MTATVKATLEALQLGGRPEELVTTLRIKNDSDAPVELLNPDLGKPSPQMHWPWSNEAYRAALLRSFGYLELSVTDEAGQPITADAIETWATPALRPPVVLAPGESIEVGIPIGRFYALEPGGRYRVAVAYGDDTLRVKAAGEIQVPVDGPSAEGAPADGA